jgi:hypothetical protein
MANIPAALKDWSATAASNQPDTSDSNTIVADLQQIQATVRGHLASRATIASGSTVDLSTITGVIASVTHSSGTTAISSFGTLSAGIWKIVTFAITGGTLSLTHHATQMIIPGSLSLTLVNGDSLIAESLGSGNWKIHVFQSIAGSTAFKVGTFTRVMSVASGNVAYTGVGFKPKAVLFLATVTNGTVATTSKGVDDGTSRFALIGFTTTGDDAGFTSSSAAISLFDDTSSANTNTAVVASFDADGFTLTWTKAGTPTTTANIGYLALR